ncbi:MAG TPA: hypothetical protein VGO69_01485 [Pyrinomonadaceae bacterium]|nr:hypothetical protein [Pyrinomonadaceae bacterium]
MDEIVDRRKQYTLILAPTRIMERVLPAHFPKVVANPSSPTSCCSFVGYVQSN